MWSFKFQKQEQFSEQVLCFHDYFARWHKWHKCKMALRINQSIEQVNTATDLVLTTELSL